MKWIVRGFFLLTLVGLGLFAIRSEIRVRRTHAELQRVQHRVEQLAELVQSLQKSNRLLRIRAGLDPDPGIPESLGTGGGIEPSDPLEARIAQLDEEIDRVLALARYEVSQTQTLQKRLEEIETTLRHLPSILPTRGYITSRYGYRTDPFTGGVKFHQGVDILAPKGTPVYAPADGRVISIRKTRGYGLTLKIDHGNGITTFYAHLYKVNVKRGQRVHRGDVIAYVGSSGRSTGHHLHYEVRVRGIRVNPRRYIIPETVYYE